jgi:hypothetical protein
MFFEKNSMCPSPLSDGLTLINVTVLNPQNKVLVSQNLLRNLIKLSNNIIKFIYIQCYVSPCVFECKGFLLNCLRQTELCDVKQGNIYSWYVNTATCSSTAEVMKRRSLHNEIHTSQKCVPFLIALPWYFILVFNSLRVGNISCKNYITVSLICTYYF